jgi:hypothetical protein
MISQGVTDPRKPILHHPPPSKGIRLKFLHEGAASLQQLSSAEKPIFIQLRTLYNSEHTQYHRFLSEQAKLRIAGTVSEAKRSQLRPEKSVREWIKSLQASTQPIDTQMQDMVRARHRVMMGDSLEAEICLCIGARTFGPSMGWSTALWMLLGISFRRQVTDMPYGLMVEFDSYSGPVPATDPRGQYIYARRDPLEGCIMYAVTGEGRDSQPAHMWRHRVSYSWCFRPIWTTLALFHPGNSVCRTWSPGLSEYPLGIVLTVGALLLLVVW